MAVKFLSKEWADAVTMALNKDDAFRKAAAGKKASIQQLITGPEGQVDYWIVIDDGSINMGLGEADKPDATITQSYATAVALARASSRRSPPT